MPIDEAHAKELKGLMNAAKQQPVHFGLCLGAKPETDTFLLHRNKAPSALGMEARKEAKGTKFAIGTATVEGTTLQLACEEKPPTGLAKRTKAMLKTLNLRFKVKLVGADGEVFEEDGEEEDAAPGAQAAQAPDPAQAEWSEMRSKLEADVQAFLSAGTGDVSRVRASWAMATEAADQRDFAGAVKVGTRLAELLAGGETAARPVAPPPPPQATPPDPAALKARLTSLVQSLPQVMEAHPELKEGLLKLAKDAQLMLGTNNLKTAAARIEELASAIAVGSKASVPTAADAAKNAGTAGAVVYAKSRLAWLATRKKVEAEMEKLRDALLDAYKDEDIVPELDKRYRDVTAPIMAQLDETLADTLDEATNATDPAQRAQKVADARMIIGRYQAFLAGDTVIAKLDQNPIVPVTIAATLNATLTSLSVAIR